MTIKIKAPVIWLDKDDCIEFLSKRCSDRESKYRIVSESDWLKLMKLVKVLEAESWNTYRVWGALEELEKATEALEKKK